jgi:hypothetical protein
MDCFVAVLLAMTKREWTEVGTALRFALSLSRELS